MPEVLRTINEEIAKMFRDDWVPAAPISDIQRNSSWVLFCSELGGVSGTALVTHSSISSRWYHTADSALLSLGGRSFYKYPVLPSVETTPMCWLSLFAPVLRGWACSGKLCRRCQPAGSDYWSSSLASGGRRAERGWKRRRLRPDKGRGVNVGADWLYVSKEGSFRCTCGSCQYCPAFVFASFTIWSSHPQHSFWHVFWTLPCTEKFVTICHTKMLMPPEVFSGWRQFALKCTTFVSFLQH